MRPTYEQMTTEASGTTDPVGPDGISNLRGQEELACEEWTPRKTFGNR